MLPFQAKQTILKVVVRIYRSLPRDERRDEVLEKAQKDEQALEEMTKQFTVPFPGEGICESCGATLG